MPTGPPSLCALSDTRSAPTVQVGQVEPRRGLDGVGEDVRLRGAPAHCVDHVGHRLHDTRLVVGGHDRNQGDPRGQRPCQRVRIEDAAAVHRQLAGVGTGPRRRAGRLAHRRVLDRRGEHHRLAALVQRGLRRPEHGAGSPPRCRRR